MLKRPEIEKQVPRSFSCVSNDRTYLVELTDFPLIASTVYDFVWDAFTLDWQIKNLIETWKEPLKGETLVLVICLMNVLVESACLLLTSHVVTVVMI